MESASSLVSSYLLWISEQLALLSELVLDHPIASSLTALVLAVTTCWWLVSVCCCRRLPTKRKGDTQVLSCLLLLCRVCLLHFVHMRLVLLRDCLLTSIEREMEKASLMPKFSLCTGLCFKPLTFRIQPFLACARVVCDTM